MEFPVYLITNQPRRRASLLPQLRPFWEKWSDPAIQEQMRPLRIRAEIVGLVAGFGYPKFDNLLARLVVEQALGYTDLDDAKAPYILPVPLKIVWTAPDTNLPLYAANPLKPVQSTPTMVHYNKKLLDDRISTGKGQIHGGKGRFKEKQIPIPADASTVWETTCIGLLEDIARLLFSADRIGKKRLAKVLSWDIDYTDAFIFSRPLPVRYLHPELAENNRLPLDVRWCGWTPPYWPRVPECQDWCVYYGE